MAHFGYDQAGSPNTHGNFECRLTNTMFELPGCICGIPDLCRLPQALSRDKGRLNIRHNVELLLS